MKISKMFKVIALSVIAATVLSFSAFAATVEYTDIEATEINSGADYQVVVNYNASDYATGDQVTMLVLTGSEDITYDPDNSTVPNNVMYIDQQTIGADSGSFTFVVAKDLIEENKIFVKLGATSQETADKNEYTFETTEPGTGEDVTVTVNPSIGDAFGVTDLSYTKITGASGTKSLKVNGADVVCIKHADEFYYFVLSTGNVTVDSLEWSDEAPTVSMIGDVKADGQVDIFDATAVLSVVSSSISDDQTVNFLTDAKPDGVIDIFDATAVLNLVAGGTPEILQ